MLQEPADDADDGQVIGNPGDPRPDAAAVPDDQLDANARSRGSIEGARDIRVFQRVHLEADQPGVVFGVHRDLPIDL